MKTILITGASTGIVYGTAKVFTRAGYQVFGSVRQEKDAQRLVAELGSNFIPLQFDVTDANALQQAAQQVAARVGPQGLGGIVNNAGIATSGPLVYQPIDEIRWQFEVNVIAPIAVIQAFFPFLATKQSSPAKPARIINISSVGGQVAPPFLGAYVGTKHAIEGLSHSLRRELQLHGIDVIIIGPGAVNTPIWDKESAQEMSQYEGTKYAPSMRTFQHQMVSQGKAGYAPEKIGQFIYAVFERKNPKSRYAIVPNPIPNWIIPRLLPDRWLDKLIGKTLGLLSNDPKEG
jgi:NAD(P)-dependent dehydrogenase (short-subunit alcohol dehydrogenase family)